MPYQVALSDLVTDLRAELGHSTNAAQGVNYENSLKQTLRRVQQSLHADYDWPHLMLTDEKVPLTADVRYYTYPTGLTFDQVNKLYSPSGTQWRPMEYGIGPAQYSVWNSSNGKTSWPPQRWQNHARSTTNDEFEVWPVPNQGNLELLVTGQLALGPLVDDADKCTLDSDILVLSAAGELLQRQNQEDAELKVSKAQVLIQRVLGQQRGDKRRPWIMGGGAYPVSAPRPYIDYIPIGG